MSIKFPNLLIMRLYIVEPNTQYRATGISTYLREIL